MKSNKEKIFVVIVIALLIGALYGAWSAISLFVTSLASADPKVSAAIIGAMTTAFVGIAAVVITQRQIKLREIEEAHRAKKVEIYQKYLDTITSVVAGQNEQVTINPPTEQELIDYLVSFKTEILLWGSPKVIKAQLEFEKISGSGGDILVAVNDLFKAIREDIGLSNKGLNNFELIKIFIKDHEELDEMNASNK